MFLLILSVCFSQGFKFSVGKELIWGYNRDIAEIWNYTYNEVAPFDIKYGFNKVGKLKFDIYNYNYVEIGLGFKMKGWSVLFGYGLMDDANFGYRKVQSGEDVLYFVRMFNSILFPVVNTDFPYYASFQEVNYFQSIQGDRFYFRVSHANYIVGLNLLILNEKDGVRLDEFAKIFDFFYNHITIKDLSEIKRKIYSCEFLYNYKRGIFGLNLGVELGYEFSRIRNNWIDIDSGYFKNKVDNSRNYFLFDGLIYQSLKLKNFVFGLVSDLSVRYNLGDVIFSGGVAFRFYPVWYVRYEMDYPWGVGIPTPAKTGLRFVPLKNGVLFLRLKLIELEVNL